VTDRVIIDSHVHLKHGDVHGTEFTPEAVVRIMDEAGIAKSVVFAMSTTTRRSIQMASEAVKKFPDRLIPYAYALPSYERPVLKEIEEAVSGAGFGGIKLHVGQCTLAGYVTDPLMELAGRLGVPCLIDCGGRHAEIEAMAARFPQTKIIVAHLGRYLCKDAAVIDRFIALAEARANIFLDASGVVLPEKIADAVRRIGSRQVIFGTDGPQAAPDTAEFARAEVRKIRDLRLAPEDEREVLGGSIARLLGLGRP
jgi:predicted TIM-barrel fold metal-dependent hydrolase